MKNNEELQKDVQDALKWEPLLNAAEIGVVAKDGVITLMGTVDSYPKKMEAEHAAKSVSGVKAVVEEIDVKFFATSKTDDNEIAKEILKAYKWNWEVPEGKVTVKVEDGLVTLDGIVNWDYQKQAARKAISSILGIRAVANNISIKTETHDQIEQKDIERALVRNWSLIDKNIRVKVIENKVTLNGVVHSLYQKEEAGRIAWNAPGVITVNNELVIEYCD